MSEATEIIQLAAPYISYVVPAVFLFSVLTVAEYSAEFLFKLFRQFKGRVTF